MRIVLPRYSLRHCSPILIFSSSNLVIEDELTEGVGEGVEIAFGFTAIPLFQTNLFPCFTQVYLIFETIFVVPNLVHFDPAIAPLARLIGRRAIETVG